jgi:hypothetical protein
MKNMMALSVLFAFFTIFITSGVTAQCAGMGGGSMRHGAAMAVAPEILQKFNKETKGLQEQLIDKQALLKKEFLKDDPDPDAIAVIRKAMIDIQRDMQKIAKKLGMKNGQGTCCMSQGNCCGWGGGGEMRPNGQKCPGHDENHGHEGGSENGHK